MSIPGQASLAIQLRNPDPCQATGNTPKYYQTATANLSVVSAAVPIQPSKAVDLTELTLAGTGIIILSLTPLAVAP